MNIIISIKTMKASTLKSSMLFIALLFFTKFYLRSKGEVKLHVLIKN
jgi:hypothetical protein